MRTRFVGVSGGVLSKDSCRGDGNGRTVYASIETLYKELITDAVELLYEQPDTNYGDGFLIRIARATGITCYGLFYVDLSAYAGRSVIAATFNFYVVEGSTTRPGSCHEVWAEWHEMQATYNDRLTGVPWSVPKLAADGDIDPDAFALHDFSAPGWHEVDVSIPVAAWLAGTRANYGIFCYPGSDTLGATPDIASDDYYLNPDLKPYLELLLA